MLPAIVYVGLLGSSRVAYCDGPGRLKSLHRVVSTLATVRIMLNDATGRDIYGCFRSVCVPLQVLCVVCDDGEEEEVQSGVVKLIWRNMSVIVIDECDYE